LQQTQNPSIKLVNISSLDNKPMLLNPLIMLQGYAAGNAVPSPQKNVERAFLSKYWSHWQADHSGRR
jgi:hypothetical protein